MDRISMMTLALAKKYTKKSISALEQVVRYIGVTTTEITDGSTTNPITINGQSVTAVAGDTVFYNGTSYAWDGSAWQEVMNIAEIITAVEALGGKVHDILADIAPEFDSASTYAVDDVVLYEDDLYIFTNAHTGAWDSSDVTVTSIAQLVDDLRAEIASTNGRVSALEAHVTQSGDVIDSDNHSLHIVGEAIEAEKTVSGNPITVTDALPYNAVSLSAEIEPIQDLHGYDKPWVGGAEKNKFNPNFTGVTGITPSVDSNGYLILTVSGAVSATFLKGQSIALKANTAYTLSCVGASSDVRVSLRNSDGSIVYASVEVDGGSSTCTPTEDTTVYFYLRVATSAALTATLKPQLEIGSSKTTFAPYSNICPISGRDSVVVTRSDGDEISEDFTIQLGQTVYGADINWDTGVMTVTGAIADMGDLTWNYVADIVGFYTDDMVSTLKKPASNLEPINAMCEACPVVARDRLTEEILCANINGRIIYKTSMYGSNAAVFKTAMDGMHLCYELATPQTIQLTPTQLTMLKGYNRLSSDGGGDITLTYRANKADSVQAEVDALDANKAEKTTIAPVENGTKASKAYAVGQHFIRDDKFCTAIAAISSGATLTKSTNYKESDINDSIFSDTNIVVSQDLNNYTKAGVYRIESSVTNAPVAWCNMLVFNNGSDIIQMIVKTNGTIGEIYIRTYDGSPKSWKQWFRISGTAV